MTGLAIREHVRAPYEHPDAELVMLFDSSNQLVASAIFELPMKEIIESSNKTNLA